MGLEQIVNVQILRETQGVSQAGFGVPMFLGTHSVFAERSRIYSKAADLLSDGFSTGDPEYKAAAAVFSQEIKPTSLVIGRRTADVAKVVTVTVAVVQNSFLYQVTINGTTVGFTSDASATAAEISAGLVAAINGDVTLGPVVTAADLVGTFTVTADVAGDDFTSDMGTNLTQVTSTANQDIVTSIQAVRDENDDWYAMGIDSRTTRDIKKVAAYIETVRRIFAACTEDTDILASGSGDIASFLKNANYFRTFHLWSGVQENYPEMAMLGRILPDDPGSETWAFKTLAGVTADAHTATQENNLKTKNSNYYIVLAGVAITLQGKMAGGEFIDIIRFVDWLQARLEEGIYAKLVNSEKIPFTDAGAALIESVVREVLARGVRVGGLANDPEPEVFVPRVLDVPVADRTARLLPDITFTARLAGAIHAVEITGTVTV